MAPSDSLFLLFDVHYDGKFLFSPLRYDDGLVYQWGVRKDNHVDLASMRQTISERTHVSYVKEIFFKLPNCELDVGLKIIENDRDLEVMYEYAHEHGIIQVYLTHLEQDLAPYYVENMCLYESDDEWFSRRRCVPKHAGNMSQEELVAWAEEEAALAEQELGLGSVDEVGLGSVDDVGLGSVYEEEVGQGSVAEEETVMGIGLVDKGKGIMTNEESNNRKNARRRNSGIVIGENVDPRPCGGDASDSDMEQRFVGNEREMEEVFNCMSDTDDEESDKSVDYLSECEDELISLRKRHSDAKKNPRQSTNCGSSSPMPESSRPSMMYDTGETPTVMEHEEYMDTLMQQLRGRGDALADPFIIVEEEQRKEKFPIHDEQTHWKMRKPKVGEKYINVDQLKECLTYYSLANGFSLWFCTLSKDKLIARCGRRPEKLKDVENGKQKKQDKYPTLGANEGTNCPFRCYGRKMVTESSFQVISLNEEHTWVRDFKYGNLVTYKWIAKPFGHKIRQNPLIKLHEIADLVMKKYKCIVSPCQCRYAKSKALNEAENTIQEHYAMIRSYGKEILDTNDGSTVKLGVTVNPDNKTYFDRFYCCFYGLKRGFQLGCRPVIALDGCFLKKPNVGEILTAVGRDGNNHIYPIAWAIVNVENKDNWAWFLELLGLDIELPTGNGLYNFMSCTGSPK